MSDPTGQHDAPRPGSAPPTRPVWGFTPPPPRWPVVIGIVSAALSVFSLGSYGLVLVMSFVLGGKMFPGMGQGAGGMKLFTGPYWMIEVGLYAVTLVGTVVSLAAGLRTVQRRPSGRGLHLWGTAIVVLAVVATSVVDLVGLNPAMARMGNVPRPIPLWLTTTMTLVIMLAYPVFLLIWFGPMGKSPEQGTAAGPGAGWVATGGGWRPERPQA